MTEGWAAAGRLVVTALTFQFGWFTLVGSLLSAADIIEEGFNPSTVASIFQWPFHNLVLANGGGGGAGVHYTGLTVVGLSLLAAGRRHRTIDKSPVDGIVRVFKVAVIYTTTLFVMSYFVAARPYNFGDLTNDLAGLPELSNINQWDRPVLVLVGFVVTASTLLCQFVARGVPKANDIGAGSLGGLQVIGGIFAVAGFAVVGGATIATSTSTVSDIPRLIAALLLSGLDVGGAYYLSAINVVLGDNPVDPLSTWWGIIIFLAALTTGSIVLAGSLRSRSGSSQSQLLRLGGAMFVVGLALVAFPVTTELDHAVLPGIAVTTVMLTIIGAGLNLSQFRSGSFGNREQS